MVGNRGLSADHRQPHFGAQHEQARPQAPLRKGNAANHGRKPNA